ncbi:MAG: insulinase family protein [Myxococcales bacterium]|nr:insulinase family protein [Myxococcales bacterium]
MRTYDPPVQMLTQTNGLRVVLVELAHLHTTTVSLFIKVGSRFETAHENGLSHFVEHMLFRGTERYASSLLLNTAVERLGSMLHAETGRDYTLFQMGLPPERLAEGLDIIADLMSSPRFEDIDLERELVLEELNEDYNDDGAEINDGDLARGLLFGDHPLGQRIAGSRANVQRFTRDEVMDFFRRYYGAANSILCVAGPHTMAEVTAATAPMAKVPKGIAAVVPGVVAPQTAAHPRITFVEDAGSQTNMTLVLQGFAEASPQYLPMVGLLRCLDDGMSTRLHYELCDQKGLAYSINAGVDALTDISLFEISGATAHHKVVALIEALAKILASLRETPVTDAELDRIRTRYRYELLASFDDGSAMASWFGGTRLYADPPSLGSRLHAIEQLTAAQITAVARELLQPHRLAAAFVGKITEKRQREIEAALAAW